MAHSSIRPLEVPLHRLIKRQEAAALLEGFEAILHGGDLALVGPDGRPLAGGETLPQAEVAELLAQVKDSQVVCGGELLLQPLLIKSQLLGAVVWRGGPVGDLGRERVLNCLAHSLTLLLGQALETRDLARETLDRYREINLLYDVAQTIGGRLDPEEIPGLVLDEARRIIPTETGAVLFPPADEGEFEIRVSFGAPDGGKSLGRVCRQVVMDVYGSGRPAITTDLRDEVLPVGPVLCAPLKAREQVLGVILLRRPAGEPEFSAGDEKLLMALATQAAIALETARLHQEEIRRQRLEEDLAIARQIQLSLLPERCPIVPGWEFAAMYRPARLVGGDLYDFIQFPGEPDRLGLVIADVTGKGVSAALIMAFSRTVIRTLSMGARNREPATALTRVNRSMVNDIRLESRLFVSTFYATLDTVSGRLTYANGGHNWPLWQKAASGEMQYLDGHGVILGIFNNVDLEDYVIQVAPGDVLVFYTDGVTEARNAEGEMFEDERLRDVLAAHPGAGAQQVLDGIVEAVDAFTGKTPQSDDITLFVVKRQGNS